MSTVQQLFKITKGKKEEALDGNQNNSVRYIQIEDLRHDKNLKFCIPNDKSVVVNQKDIIIAWDGANAGTVGVGLNGVIGSTLAKMELKDQNVDHYYVAKFLQSKFQYLRDNCTGATIPHISKAVLANLYIPLHPLEIQNKIVEVLDKAQALIDTRKEQIKLLDDLVQSIFQDMFGDPFTNPKGWDIIKIEDVCEKITDGEHSTPKRTHEGIKLLSARNVKNGYIDFEAGLDYIDESEYERISKRCCPEYGDILISCSGSIGRVTMVNVVERLSLVRSVALLKPKKTIVNPKYMESYMQTGFMNMKMISSSKSSSQANLFLTPIKQLPYMQAPIDLQNQFAEIVQKIESQKHLTEKSLEEMKNNYNGLMQKAFKGELFS